jgi:hypothetical protein
LVPSEGPQAGQQYRLYFLDALGHLSKAHEFFAEDDSSATKIAEGWREGRRTELWSHARMVCSWDEDHSG